jgi:hypothetical protein
MNLPFFERLEQKILDARDKGGFRLKPWPLVIGGVVLLFLAFVFFPAGLIGALNLALFLSPLWLTALIVTGAWFLWITLIRSEFIAAQPVVLLEIRPPRSIVKTPLAMETLLTGLYHVKGESNWYQKIVQGKVRPYWSLEIASLEGKIHLYIWTRSEFRRLVESAIYAQYPGAQVVEVPDYTQMITATTQDYAVWGCDFKHTAPDPYPIKTYVDFGLDKVAEEPEQTDPLSNVIEFLGTIGKGEYFWTQIIVRTAGSEKYHGEISEATGKQKTWRDEATLEIEKIRKMAGTKAKFFDPTTGKMVESEGFPNPTKGQSEMIAAIERNVSKLAFDVGIRAVYVAEPSKFNPVMITGMIGMWNPFNSKAYNTIKATHWGIDFQDYPWELNNEKKKDVFRKHIVQAYRRRQFFYEPFSNHDFMTMSTEELATIFHIPSAAVEAPSLTRIQSATGEAPPNLPT